MSRNDQQDIIFEEYPEDNYEQEDVEPEQVVQKAVGGQRVRKAVIPPGYAVFPVNQATGKKQRKELSEESKQKRRDQLVLAREAKKAKAAKDKEILAAYKAFQEEVSDEEPKKKTKPKVKAVKPTSKVKSKKPISEEEQSSQSEDSEAEDEPKPKAKRKSKRTETDSKLEALEQRLNDILTISKHAGTGNKPRVIKKTTVIQPVPVPTNPYFTAPQQPSNEVKNNLKKVMSMF